MNTWKTSRVLSDHLFMLSPEVLHEWVGKVLSAKTKLAVGK